MNDIRQEEIPLFSKSLKLSNKQDLFQKPISVFRDWIEDTDDIVKNCLSHDTRNWKVKRFVDKEDYGPILDVIKKRYKDLKSIFMGQTIENYTAPDFFKRQFFKFCE